MWGNGYMLGKLFSNLDQIIYKKLYQLSPNTKILSENLDDYYLDSLDLISLLTEIKNKLNLTLDPAELSYIKTFAELKSILRKKISMPYLKEESSISYYNK